MCMDMFLYFQNYIPSCMEESFMPQVTFFNVTWAAFLSRWVQAPSPEKVMREKLDGVDEFCSGDLVTTVSSKVSHREWLFTLQTCRLLRAVALLQDTHRNHFFLR